MIVASLCYTALGLLSINVMNAFCSERCIYALDVVNIRLIWDA
jgi:hypothetical protein